MLHRPRDVEALRERSQVRNWLRKLRCWWRLKWNLCPACNSDALEARECKVCTGYNPWLSGWPPSGARKAEWRIRFLNQQCEHGVDRDRQCKSCAKCIAIISAEVRRGIWRRG